MIEIFADWSWWQWVLATFVATVPIVMLFHAGHSRSE